MLLNWTEILARAGVPDAPGYQELLARIREEKVCSEGEGKKKAPSPGRKRGKGKRK